jgi:poly(3-hydroxybutyrate) depolymerase
MRVLVLLSLTLFAACSSAGPHASDLGSADQSTMPADGGAADGASSPGQGSGGSGGAPLTACPSCVVHVPPGYDASHPVRLVVALHGDEGREFGLDAATAGVIALWRDAADAAGFLLFAPACPAAHGCDGAFSDWLAADGYDPPAASLGWLDTQVDELEARYNIDRSREYLGGHSGGAYWLGAYAPARASRYAAVAFVAGGMPAYHTLHGCPSRSLPGYFLGGDGDPRTSGQMSDTANAFQACGEPIQLQLVTGADHEATIASLANGNAAAILAWFAMQALP